MDDTADQTWILRSAFLVFTMQAGFGMLEAGMVSWTNKVNTMMKNFADISFGALLWFALGWAFAYGDGNSFVGHDQFFSDVDPDQYGFWVFQFSFAATAATIFSGSVVERMKFGSYLGLTSVITGFIYPIPVHWVWHEQGWLGRLGFHDFAGCGPVHMVGGFCGLAGCFVLGPRRFLHQGMSNAPSVLLGTFILWWGWYGFNCGSSLMVSNGWWRLSGKVAMNTTIGASAGAAMGLIFSIVTENTYSLSRAVNGCLSGLVGITAGCAVMTSMESYITAVIACLVQVGSQKLLDKSHRFDDPISAISVHGFAGMWGCIAVGLFAQPNTDVEGGPDVKGLFHGGGWHQLGVQLAGVVAIGVWTLSTMFATTYVIDRVWGVRVSSSVEAVGLDVFEHNSWDGPASGKIKKMLETLGNAGSAPKPEDVMRTAVKQNEAYDAVVTLLHSYRHQTRRSTPFRSLRSFLSRNRHNRVMPLPANASPLGGKRRQLKAMMKDSDRSDGGSVFTGSDTETRSEGASSAGQSNPEEEGCVIM